MWTFDSLQEPVITKEVVKEVVKQVRKRLSRKGERLVRKMDKLLDVSRNSFIRTKSGLGLKGLEIFHKKIQEAVWEIVKVVVALLLWPVHHCFKSLLKMILNWSNTKKQKVHGSVEATIYQ
jgi:hypothetical protein